MFLWCFVAVFVLEGCPRVIFTSKVVVCNQENFLTLQPDTSPAWNKIQNWVSSGTLLKIRNPCMEPGHGSGVTGRQREGKLVRKLVRKNP